MAHGVYLIIAAFCIAIFSVLEVRANSADILLYGVARGGGNSSEPPALGGLTANPMADVHESVGVFLKSLESLWDSLFYLQAPDEINYTVSRRAMGGRREPRFTEYFRLRKRESIA